MKRILLMTVFLILAIFAQGQKDKEKMTTEASMTIKNNEGHIQIGFFGNNKNIQISFYPCGVNKLFAIAKVSYFACRVDYLHGKTSNEFSSVTDWVGPYFVCSTSSVLSGVPQKFTGGWHGSNGDGTGNPTAKTSEVSLVVDEEKTSGNFERNCKKVDLYVTNLVHGYDYMLTNKDLLKETVRYTINPDRQIDVHVKIEALEDLVIQRYYGLQSQNFNIFDSISYMAGQRVINAAAINANSNCQTNERVNTICLTDKEQKHQLKLVLNIETGLGVPGSLGEGKPKAFSASYGKSYFNLVNGKDLPMKKGEEVFWQGSYFWD